MEKVILNFPNVISVELPKDKLVVPFAGLIDPKIVQKVLDMSWRGVAHRDGKWRIDPGFQITKESTGKYKITHNLGYTNTSLSVSLLVSPGGATIVEHSSMYFVIQTVLDKVPTDLDFCFTLIRVIVQPAPQAAPL